jgi:hypothetical protein
MDKSDLMKRYEAETGESLEEAKERWKTFAFYSRYIAWLEAKAAAYDRLMSGEYTLKDMSNIFQMYSAIDADGYARLFADPPFIDRVGWSSNFPEDEFSIPGGVKHTGNWETSLTVPDGWEEK